MSDLERLPALDDEAQLLQEDDFFARLIVPDRACNRTGFDGYQHAQ